MGPNGYQMRPVAINSPKPDPDVIQFLEGVLQHAREGRINGVLVFHTGPGQLIGQGSEGFINPADMLYNIELWKYRYFKKNEG